MIIIDGKKHACVQCIRGHRSSTCKHNFEGRVLLEVRGRGRPSLSSGPRIAVLATEALAPGSSSGTLAGSTPNGGSSHRQSNEQVPQDGYGSSPLIKEEIVSTKVPTPKTSCCSSKKKAAEATKKHGCSCPGSKVTKPGKSNGATSCKCSKTGTIMLRNSGDKHMVHYNKGTVEFIGKYDPKMDSTGTFKVELKAENGGHMSCHPPQDGTRNGQQPLSQFKPLRTLMVNPVSTPQPQPHPQQYQPIQPKPSNGDGDPLLQNFGFPTTQGQPMFTYPQLVNGGITNGHSIDKQFQQLGLINNGEAQQQNPLQQNPQPQYYDMYMADGCTVSCNCGPTCQCANCLIHRTTAELSAAGLIETSASTPNEEPRVVSDENGELVIREQTPEHAEFMQFQTINMFVNGGMEDCMCAEEDCACFNCFRHGIVNGVRQKDGVRVAAFDLQGQASELSVAALAGLEQQLADLPDDFHVCGCEPDECECFNCDKHGLVNGVRTQ